MARIHIGETFTLLTDVIDRTNGNLTDAPDLTLRYKAASRRDETTVTPTRVSTGIYSAEITPDTSGNLFYRWDTDGAFDVAREGNLLVRRSAFEDCNTNDYN